MAADSFDSSPGDITEVLGRLNCEDSWAELVPLVYRELRELARSYMLRERIGHVLEPTALVHETYLRLVRSTSIRWKNRCHFYGVAALLMRRILVDHARRLRAERRALTVTGPELVSASGSAGIDVEVLSDALDRLASMDARQCRVVELRYFGGLSVDEVASLLSVSTRTVKRDWNVARAWLHGELSMRSR
ncbi:ECF-type sigma factor [uncultured Paludibaculum sp.]|uniref:ECF-type sigma factor n=1 Tax=uncultured Paludibaculum sp. TaxID=1765020 RepID=UPI002AAAA06A|nr:ECF-type sigma factor [uncultured Paludibaculum sp.]